MTHLRSPPLRSPHLALSNNSRKTHASPSCMADPLLPAPAQLELNQGAALFALLMGGEWAAAVLRLLVLPLPKPKAAAIWKRWKTHLAHPPSHPIGET